MRVTSALRRAVLQLPESCPPRTQDRPLTSPPPCRDPFTDADVPGVVVVSVCVALASLVVLTWLALRKDQHRPAFAPKLGLLTAALGLLGVGAILTVWRDRPAVPLLPTVLGFLGLSLAGASLRPRGHTGRGVLLGMGVYLGLGVAVVLIVNAINGVAPGEITLTPLTLAQVLFWPEILAASIRRDYMLG